MTWRYRLIRTRLGAYDALHSVFLGTNHIPKYYAQDAETFVFSEEQHFDSDEDARALMIELLTKALEDVTNAPMLALDDNGAFVAP